MIGNVSGGKITLSVNGVEIGEAQSINITPPPLPQGATGYRIYRDPAYPPSLPVRHMKSRKWFRRRNKGYWRSQQRKPIGGGTYEYAYYWVKAVEK